jgi:hypothetical protein
MRLPTCPKQLLRCHGISRLRRVISAAARGGRKTSLGRKISTDTRRSETAIAAECRFHHHRRLHLQLLHLSIVPFLRAASSWTAFGRFSHTFRTARGLPLRGPVAHGHSQRRRVHHAVSTHLTPHLSGISRARRLTCLHRSCDTAARSNSSTGRGSSWQPCKRVKVRHSRISIPSASVCVIAPQHRTLP